MHHIFCIIEHTIHSNTHTLLYTIPCHTIPYRTLTTFFSHSDLLDAGKQPRSFFRVFDWRWLASAAALVSVATSDTPPRAAMFMFQVPVHDKNRRDQIGAELRLLKHCRADAAARFEEEAKQEASGEDAVAGQATSRAGTVCGGFFFLEQSDVGVFPPLKDTIYKKQRSFFPKVSTDSRQGLPFRG